MSVLNEDAATQPPSEATGPTDSRIRELELQIEQLQKGHELLLCFGFLTVVHVFVFCKLVPLSLDSAWPTWIGLSGIGTISVWFAWTERPVWQRSARVLIALAAAALMAQQAVPYFMRQRRYSVVTSSAFSVNGEFMLFSSRPVATHDSVRSIVICWIVGAFMAAFLVTWFLGFRFQVPGIGYKRRPMSIRSILALTFFAALASYFIRSANWADRSLYFVNGMTLGFVASGFAWGVFQQRTWQRLAYPLGVMVVVVALDLVVGGFLNVWKGSVLDRLQYVAIFVGGLSTSPLFSFALLRHYGYRMTSSRNQDQHDR